MMQVIPGSSRSEVNDAKDLKPFRGLTNKGEGLLDVAGNRAADITDGSETSGAGDRAIARCGALPQMRSLEGVSDPSIQESVMNPITADFARTIDRQQRARITREYAARRASESWKRGFRALFGLLDSDSDSDSDPEPVVRGSARHA